MRTFFSGTSINTGEKLHTYSMQLYSTLQDKVISEKVLASLKDVKRAGFYKDKPINPATIDSAIKDLNKEITNYNQLLAVFEKLDREYFNGRSYERAIKYLNATTFDIKDCEFDISDPKKCEIKIDDQLAKYNLQNVLSDLREKKFKLSKKDSEKLNQTNSFQKKSASNNKDSTIVSAGRATKNTVLMVEGHECDLTLLSSVVQALKAFPAQQAQIEAVDTEYPSSAHVLTTSPIGNGCPIESISIRWSIRPGNSDCSSDLDLSSPITYTTKTQQRPQTIESSYIKALCRYALDMRSKENGIGEDEEKVQLSQSTVPARSAPGDKSLQKVKYSAPQSQVQQSVAH